MRESGQIQVWVIGFQGEQAPERMQAAIEEVKGALVACGFRGGWDCEAQSGQETQSKAPVLWWRAEGSVPVGPLGSRGKEILDATQEKGYSSYLEKHRKLRRVGPSYRFQLDAELQEGTPEMQSLALKRMQAWLDAQPPESLWAMEISGGGLCIRLLLGSPRYDLILEQPTPLIFA